MERRVNPGASGDENGDYSVILFDGWCPLCIRTVRIVLEADTRSVFRFAALDSSVALFLLDRRDGGRSSDDVEAARGGSSVVLLTRDHVHVRSEAVLRIAGLLPWPWPLVAVFRLVPRAVRDAVYEAVSRRRQRTWGRLDHCYIPPTEHSDRFLVSVNRCSNAAPESSR